MIKKFDEFIKEGFWKSGINRAKTNTIRQEDIPHPIDDKFDRRVYQIEEYPEYYIAIAWLKREGFIPAVYLYHESDEYEPAGTYKNIKSNGIDKRFDFNEPEYTYNDIDTSYEHGIEPESGEFKDCIRRVLNKLPDSAFERMGIKYDFKFLGYPVEGFNDWFIDTSYDSYSHNHLTIMHYTNKTCGYCIYAYRSSWRVGGIIWSPDGKFSLKGKVIDRGLLEQSDGGTMSNKIKERAMTEEEIDIIVSDEFINAIEKTLSQFSVDDCYVNK